MIQTSLLIEAPGDGAKRCFKCRRILPLSEFYRHPRMADGHLNKCKDCTRLDVSKRRKANTRRCREYDRARSLRPERARQLAERSRRWRRENPRKRAAQVETGNAIRDGRLVRQPCEVCGDPKSHAHHTDYTRPLDVMWLCAVHHAEWHARHGEGLNAVKGARR